MLELKEVIQSKKDKHLSVKISSKRIYNYHNFFTNLKNENITNLNEPSKITHKESKKRKMCTYEKQTRSPINNFDINKLLKKSCGFSNMTNYTANTCITRSNIGMIIDGDDLVELLQDTRPFKMIETEQRGDIFYDYFNSLKIQC